VSPDFPVALPADANPIFPSAEKTMTPKELQTSDDRQLLDALKLVSRQANPPNITGVPKPNS
jgi:hypothetical protein